MEILNFLTYEWGVATFILPGQTESSDRHVLSSSETALLVAVADGLGHGKKAAVAAKFAASILENSPGDPLPSLMGSCHEKLRRTRGIALSVASVDFRERLMTWLGVGNVQGVLVRAAENDRQFRQHLLLRAGVVGYRLPPLQISLAAVHPGDTLIFATDGVKRDFSVRLKKTESPQETADRILQEFRSGRDDALVLVVRFARA